MSHDEVLAKLISVRHHCFSSGILGRSKDADFRQAFLTVNRLYVCLRDNVKAMPDTRKPTVLQRKRAA